jgi:predicted Zn-dependent protease with MMP-like domain
VSAESTDDPLEPAWLALEEGSAEDALSLCASADEQRVDLWVLRATAQLDLGRIDQAVAAASRAEELGGGDEPSVLWVLGEIQLALWQVDAAGELYERLLEIQREGAPLERLALVRDLQGRFDESDALLAEAQELDAELHPMPPRLPDEEFDAVIEHACAALPDEFRSALEQVPIVVEPVPPADLVMNGNPLELPPDLLGLFVGASQLEHVEDDPVGNVPRIYLFQRNIERACSDREDAAEQVRVTLFHELGHYLGFDEEGVESMGLG